MKNNRVWAVLGLLWAVALPCPSFAEPMAVIGRVTGVIDGDTIVLLDLGLNQYRIRLAEIDAPESEQAFGQRSKQSLSDLAYNREATAECNGMHRERHICKVWVGGVDVNLVQVQRGMAWASTKYVKDTAIIRAHHQARMNRVGLWADPAPIEPWNWRKGVR